MCPFAVAVHNRRRCIRLGVLNPVCEHDLPVKDVLSKPQETSALECGRAGGCLCDLPDCDWNVRLYLSSVYCYLTMEWI